MDIADSRSWRLQHRHVDAHVAVDHSVLWNNTKLTYEQQLFGQVTSVNFSPCNSYVAATGSNHSLLLRLPASGGAVWNEQLPRRAFNIRFRDDSRLIVQCVDERVRLRSTETAFERHFEGHTRDVRDAVFLNSHMLASASDDATIRFWDLGSDQELAIAEAHSDYVRTLDRVSEHIILSGGYDRTMKVWDVRVRLTDPVASVELPKPVEKVLFVKQKSMAACATGDTVRLLDLRTLVSGKRHTDLDEIENLALHSKTVTSLSYSPAHDTLVTGGYDNRVNFVSLQGGSASVTSTLKMDTSVTSVSVSNDSSKLAIGTASGRLEIRKFEAPSTDASGMKPREKEVVLDRLTHIRRLLVAYQYHRALRVALFSKQQDVIASTLEELQRRCALHIAVSGQNDRAVVQLLRYAVAHIDSPALHRISATVVDLIFSIYGQAATKSAFFHRELLRAHKRLGSLVATLGPLSESTGLLEMALGE